MACVVYVLCKASLLTEALALVQVQMTVSEYLWRTSQSEVDCEMVKRPLLCYWFMGHIVRCVQNIAVNSPTLIRALY